MRRFLSGLIVGGGLTWLAFFAVSRDYSLNWYHGLLATAGVILAATGTELYLKLKAERELRAARISLASFGILGLVLLAVAVILAAV